MKCKKRLKMCNNIPTEEKLRFYFSDTPSLLVNTFTFTIFFTTCKFQMFAYILFISNSSIMKKIWLFDNPFSYNINIFSTYEKSLPTLFPINNETFYVTILSKLIYFLHPLFMIQILRSFLVQLKLCLQ